MTLGASDAFAAFERTGPVVGTVCTGVVIKSCERVSIDAVESGGNIYEVTTRFPTVSEFKNGRCTIVFSSGIGIADAIRASKKPNFQTLTGGTYRSISPDYIHFSCRQE